MIEEILKKESLDESDIKILIANRHLLSEEVLIRLGLIVREKIEEKPKTRASKKA